MSFVTSQWRHICPTKQHAAKAINILSCKSAACCFYIITDNKEVFNTLKHHNVGFVFYTINYTLCILYITINLSRLTLSCCVVMQTGIILDVHPAGALMLGHLIFDAQLLKSNFSGQAINRFITFTLSMVTCLSSGFVFTSIALFFWQFPISFQCQNREKL